MSLQTHTSKASLIRLDNSQVLAAYEAAKYLNGLPENERNSPEAVKTAKEIAKKRIINVRDQMNPTETDPAAITDDEGTPVAPPPKPISPEDITRRRYILAMTRIATGKVDSPEYSDQELLDIALLAGAANMPMISIGNFEQCIRDLGK